MRCSCGQEFLGLDCDKLVAWFFLFAEPVDHCAWCFSFGLFDWAGLADNCCWRYFV